MSENGKHLSDVEGILSKIEQTLLLNCTAVRGSGTPQKFGYSFQLLNCHSKTSFTKYANWTPQLITKVKVRFKRNGSQFTQTQSKAFSGTINQLAVTSSSSHTFVDS